MMCIYILENPIVDIVPHSLANVDPFGDVTHIRGSSQHTPCDIMGAKRRWGIVSVLVSKLCLKLFLGVHVQRLFELFLNFWNCRNLFIAKVT